ncbi:uncharacterized protein LOC121411344 [Lytechinus variegatus]|uniref:uncharacterized protein LOC121411344 n=1 Tax=Lytechinus variegatus TaxID=7654 RepID=UPI001BB13602|nr:uncharacterized protein LOC121411344 [Lytechinus variegatus]
MFNRKFNSSCLKWTYPALKLTSFETFPADQRIYSFFLPSMKNDTLFKIFMCHALQRGLSAPCFSHSDCLRTEICKWNPSAVELAGTCVATLLQKENTNRRHTILGRTRRKLLSDEVFDNKKTSRETRDLNSDEYDEHQHGDDRNDELQVSHRIPQASYPLPHKTPIQNNHHHDEGVDRTDDIVIDHFDEKGLPVVVITEDNRDKHAEIDTSKDYYVFGEEDDKNNPDSETKTESIVYDYVDGSEVDDGGGSDEERKEVVVDLKGRQINPGIKSIFKNPWGFQPLKAKPAEDMMDGGDDEYLNDDAQVYGVGDHKHVGTRFKHTDLTGTKIETDVGVDQFRERQQPHSLVSADHSKIALPGLLTKDLEAHNY